MNAVRRNQTWLATCAAVLVVSLFLAFQKGSAQVGRADALRSVQKALPLASVGQAGVGSAAMIMDGDWFYILRGTKLYKVQKSTMSVFQTVDLN